VKSLLDSESITYTVRGEILQDLLGWGRIVGPFNYIIGPAEFFVRRDDADKAQALLQAEGLPGDLAGPDDDP